MLEQTINVRSISIAEKIMFKKTGLIALALLTLSLVACIPVGDQEVNTKLFKNKEEMQERTAGLKPGMSMKSVFEKIQVDQKKFARMNTQEVQSSLYGNSQVQGTPEQLEQFRQKLMGYEGYSLPYREIKSNGSLGFGGMRVNKNGYDLRLVLIFERDKLLRATVDGNQEVNMDEDQSLFNLILKKGTGVGF